MPGDPYYHSKEWKQLRTAAFARDHDTCVVPGCNQRAIAVDHIKARKAGGADQLGNLRSLCKQHDNQVKEYKGKRRNTAFKVTGARADGSPLDPNHHWNAKG
jgi:5-methylcytosine-specific restriction endonuclease McrA